MSNNQENEINRSNTPITTETLNEEEPTNILYDWIAKNPNNDDRETRFRIAKYNIGGTPTHWFLESFDNESGVWVDEFQGGDGEEIKFTNEEGETIQFFISQLRPVGDLTLDDFTKTLLETHEDHGIEEGARMLIDMQGRGGFFFTKKKTRKRRKKKTRKRKKKTHNEKKTRNKKNKGCNYKRIKKTKKKKDRKWSDMGYPYRDVNKQDAIDDFCALRRLAQGNINPNSTVGNKTVDWGTEKARRKTKYRNHSFVEMWNRKDRRDKMMEFAKRIHKKDKKRTILSAIKSAIDLQWGSVNTMRAAAAIHMYKKYNATKVLDFTAGWGARMIAAMALDIDYIGIDSNTSLKPGYEKLIKLLKPYTNSKVKMIWSEAQKVNLSKVGKYDYVFTSPPYEYLEVYENMTNYEKKGSKISQPSSSQKIKLDDSAQFYDEFLVPTLKNAYKYLPKNKYICLNMPDIMYDKIKKRWKKVTRCEDYSIVKRAGGPTGKDNRRGKELIFCWKKR